MQVDVIPPPLSRGAKVALGDLCLQSPENVDIRGGRIVRLREFSADNADVTKLSAANMSVTNLDAVNVTVTRAFSVPDGDANGITYLNASKILTTDANLTYDGPTVKHLGAAAGAIVFRALNAASVGNASAGFLAANDAVTAYGYLAWRAASFTGSGMRRPNSVGLQSTGNSEGLMLGTSDNTPVSVWVNDAEVARVIATGVGVGTTTPNIQGSAMALTVTGGVTGDARAAVEIQGSRTTDATFGALRFYNQTTQSAAITADRAGANDTASLSFFTKATSPGTLTEVLRLTSTGLTRAMGAIRAGADEGGLKFVKNATLAANADLDTNLTSGSAGGLLVITDATLGTGSALVSFDIGSPVFTEVSDPGAFITVGADPGAGSSQLWVTVTGTGTVRIRNRFAAAHDVRVAFIAASGTFA